MDITVEEIMVSIMMLAGTATLCFIAWKTKELNKK
jgi:hypothetical protein